MFTDAALTVYTIADRRAGVVPGRGVFCGCAATYLRQPQARQISISICQQKFIPHSCSSSRLYRVQIFVTNVHRQLGSPRVANIGQLSSCGHGDIIPVGAACFPPTAR